MFFKLMFGAVSGIVGQINNQLKAMGDMVETPINNLVGEILGGAWEGDDADAMATEIQNVVLPMVADLIAAIGGISSGITQATDVIKNTDTKAKGLVDDLVGVFQSIF